MLKFCTEIITHLTLHEIALKVILDLASVTYFQEIALRSCDLALNLSWHFFGRPNLAPDLVTNSSPKYWQEWNEGEFMTL